jgi:hypothetical protein
LLNTGGKYFIIKIAATLPLAVKEFGSIDAQGASHAIWHDFLDLKPMVARYL